MSLAPKPEQVPKIRRTLKFYQISSYVTGIFLLLLMLTWASRRLPFLGYDLWAFGPNSAFSWLPIQAWESGEGIPVTGVNMTVLILIVHGWLYVIYLYADFRVWTLMRWPFTRFVVIGLGGIVPLLSFYTERRYYRKAHAELDAIESGAR
jgi:integral membrane protein